jgi:signal transduction histidine kinase
MEWHLKEFEKRASINAHFKLPSEELSLPDTVKTGLFRIFQESLTNVARHAHAKKVDINLKVEKEKIVLSIKDDGKGFEMEKAKSKRTLGILGMRERSYMMGGTYEVKSKPGKGTKVTVSVPYSDKD